MADAQPVAEAASGGRASRRKQVAAGRADPSPRPTPAARPRCAGASGAPAPAPVHAAPPPARRGRGSRRSAPAPAAPCPPAPSPSWWCSAARSSTSSIPIYEGHNFIGRADEKPVDIDLEDQEPPDRIWSSRQHALITFEDGQAGHRRPQQRQRHLRQPHPHLPRSEDAARTSTTWSRSAPSR